MFYDAALLLLLEILSRVFKQKKKELASYFLSFLFHVARNKREEKEKTGSGLKKKPLVRWMGRKEVNNYVVGR